MALLVPRWCHLDFSVRRFEDIFSIPPYPLGLGHFTDDDQCDGECEEIPCCTCAAIVRNAALVAGLLVEVPT